MAFTKRVGQAWRLMLGKYGEDVEIVSPQSLSEFADFIKEAADEVGGHLEDTCNGVLYGKMTSEELTMSASKFIGKRLALKATVVEISQEHEWFKALAAASRVIQQTIRLENMKLPEYLEIIAIDP